MASCPIGGPWRGPKGSQRQERCGGEGIDQKKEIIQNGQVYRVFRCAKCGGRFVAYPREITAADRKTVAYALADN